MVEKFNKLLVESLPFLAVTTILSGLIYTTIQQDIRQSNNDPQIQISEDTAASLAGGAVASSVVPTSKVDLSKSLATFIIVYDDSGQVVASSAQLDGKTPALPSGVLDYTKQKGQNRLTWQPKDGVRVAAVITKFTGTTTGSVLVGRSMREIEVREDYTFSLVGAAWVISVALVFLTVGFKGYFRKFLQ